MPYFNLYLDRGRVRLGPSPPRPTRTAVHHGPRTAPRPMSRFGGGGRGFLVRVRGTSEHTVDLTDDDDVEVISVVAPVVPAVTEEFLINDPCPVCLEEFHNGERVVILSCGGSHLFCEGCYNKQVDLDIQHQKDTYAHTLQEAVRRAEGAMRCAVCRGLSHCAVIAKAKRSGATNEASIEIN